MYGVYEGDTLAGFGRIPPGGQYRASGDFSRNSGGRATGPRCRAICQPYARPGLRPLRPGLPDNRKSLALQKKLGFQISQERMYWLF
jgi:hypothetical protein